MFPTLLAQAAETVSEVAEESGSVWESFVKGFTSVWSNILGWFEYFVQATQQPNVRLILAAILGTFGLWLLMPGRKKKYSRVFGAAVGGLAGVCLLSLAPPVSLTMSSAMFTILASLTVASAVGTVTSKSPIYSAVWFAVTLLGVGGLMLVNGAQFIGIATVAVYAGAIVVTFLFVLMLAQPEGYTHYDRISWGRTAQWLGCGAGAITACLLVWALLATPAEGIPSEGNPVLVENHVAALGSQLFSRHLIGVDVAGLLLFAALVGCVAIAGAASRRGMSPQGTTPSGMTEQVASALVTDRSAASGDIHHE